MLCSQYLSHFSLFFVFHSGRIKVTHARTTSHAHAFLVASIYINKCVCVCGNTNTRDYIDKD